MSEGSPFVCQQCERALDAAKVELCSAEGCPLQERRTTLSDGTQVYPSHRELMESGPRQGQQKGYVVLADEERAKGFVRPFRDAYRHDRCGGVTTMGRTIAETYARDPHFYGGTFCATCQAHFPVGADGQFVWADGSGERVGT